MKKIHETLFILHKCDLNINLVWEAIVNHQQKGPLYMLHHFTINLTHYIILESQSFFEEYRKHFTAMFVESEYKDRLEAVRDICKPVFKQINKWKGLESFRDNFIAHPWRNNKNSLVVPLDTRYDIPRTWIEFQFLKDLIHYIHEIIKAEFTLEMNEAMYFGNGLNEDVTPKFTGYSDITRETQNLMQEVDKKMAEHNKDYDIQFFYYSEEGV